ncbi:phospholipase carboxylesterase [Dendrothele bispora CBS 962.96]|uniref:Acyl-protein thioesterase 1 n=1 Tax=Dendrothele bispora (strain CBS 962.96) TaxID=1314807 RepID=A0A4S8LR31_DENBC|nr:phospholipase carboxylesterase [Dendrothele bispora CBS 962.96]
MLAPDVVSAAQEHDATVVFIHGLGQSNLTWKSDVVAALAPKFPNVEWILPNAPKRPVSYNDGMERPSWFDIAHLPPYDDEYNKAAITESISVVHHLIETQVTAGIDPRRIILIGFSQGAALSLMASLTSSYALGGVVSFSGWIPPRFRQEAFSRETSPYKIFWCHGDTDDEIPLSYGRDAIAFLKTRMNYSEPETLQMSVYEGLSHTINGEEVADVGTWLSSILS